MAVSWTKKFSSTDDGSVLTGTQVGQIQDDIDNGLTTANVPTPTTGDAGKVLTVKSDLTGYQVTAPLTAIAGGTSGYVLISQGTAAAVWTQKLPIANGGTASSTASDAITALLPSQGSNAGKFLVTNGTTASWAVTSASATVGDVLNIYADTERTYAHTEAAGVKKAIALAFGGALRVKFDAEHTGDSGTMTVTVYRNGSAVGTPQSVTRNGGYATFSEDISGWSAGDLAQLYMSVGSKADGGEKLKNFRIYADKYYHTIVVTD
jgi:hypothetical protein